jgi:long-chain acyl-CoA synthetase
VIISGGSNIHPREVEEVLLDPPQVREVSVVRLPDPEWGEIVAGFVVPVAGAEGDPLALDLFCRDLVARFKRPKLWRVLPELPKNNYGVLKTDPLRPPGPAIARVTGIRASPRDPLP